MLNYVALQEGRNGMAVFAKGYVNLKSSVKRRKPLPLRAAWRGLTGQRRSAFKAWAASGIKMPVPDSQLRGLLSCRLVY